MGLKIMAPEWHFASAWLIRNEKIRQDATILGSR